MTFEQALDPSATVPAARRLAWQRTYYCVYGLLPEVAAVWESFKAGLEYPFTG